MNPNAFKILSILFLGWIITGALSVACKNKKDVVPWTHSFDFDGDGSRDVVVPSFTGGAHCCYRISIRLSSTGKTRRLPFQLDGGYVGGLNLSRPDHFRISKNNKGLAELIMEIETYNGKPQPLPETWKRKYGIQTHYIVVGFPNGRLHIRDKQRKQ